VIKKSRLNPKKSDLPMTRLFGSSSNEKIFGTVVLGRFAILALNTRAIED